MKRISIVLAAVMIYAIWMTQLTVSRHEAFYTFAFDMGIFEQMMWSTTNGNFMHQTINSISYNHFGIHFQPILIFVAIIYSLIPETSTLLFLQSLAIAAGAIPIYLIAKKELGDNWISVLFPLIYLIYPFNHNVNLFDFHPIAFAPFFLGMTWYYMENKNYPKFFLFAVLALSLKESISVIIFGMAVYMILFLKNVKYGQVTLLLGVSWAFITMGYLIPSISGTPYIFASQQSISEVLFNFPVRNFFTFIGEMTRVLGFLPLLYIIPILVTSILLGRHALFEPGFILSHHYTAAITPFIFISLIYSFSRTLPYISKKFKLDSFKLQTLYIGILIILSSYFVTQSQPFNMGDIQFKPTNHDMLAQQIIDVIPQEASVIAQVHLVPHLIQREYIFMLGKVPSEWQYTADYIFFDTNPETVKELWPFAEDIDSYNQLIQSYTDNTDYELIARMEGYLVFKKI